jgi:hypothetical protein
VIVRWPDDTALRLMAASLAAWGDDVRVVLGTPPETALSSYLTKHAGAQAISTAAKLAELANAALQKIDGRGASHRRRARCPADGVAL